MLLDQILRRDSPNQLPNRGNQLVDALIKFLKPRSDLLKPLFSTSLCLCKRSLRLNNSNKRILQVKLVIGQLLQNALHPLKPRFHIGFHNQQCTPILAPG